MTKKKAAMPHTESTTENHLKEAAVYYRESWTFETAGPYMMQDINFGAFASPSDCFRYDLARIAVAFTAGSYAYRAMKQTFESFGFEAIRLYNYDRQDNNRSLNADESACGFAIKKIRLCGKITTVIVLSIRGSIGSEFPTNFILDDDIQPAKGRFLQPFHSAAGSPVHKGFLTPTGYVVKKLSQYIAEENLDPTTCKILITGHSRGAAIADLLTLKLNAGQIEACPFNPDHIYTYTFGTPNSIACNSPDIPKSLQKNIFNLINFQDAVGHLPGKYFSPGKSIYLNNYFRKDYPRHHQVFLKRYNTMVSSAKYRSWHIPGNLILRKLNRLPSKWLAKNLGGMITGLTMEDPKTTTALKLISICLSLGILETAAFKNGLGGLLLAGVSAKGITAAAKGFADKIYTNHVMETYLCLVESFKE